MIYHGFATRDFLVTGHIRLDEDSSVLEIGVGTGSTAEQIIGRVKRFCGVDVSVPLINWLTKLYEHNSSVSMYSLDVCSGISLEERFDVIYSLDTLEHVECPEGYFNFISRHLTTDGIALITYPNESEERHHGITWFNTKTELINLIDRSRLKVLTFYEVKKSMWHRLIEYCLWKLPKSMVSRNRMSPQTFEQTEAFQIIQSTSVKTKIFAYYARLVVRLASIFSLFRFFEVGEDINNKVLLIYLKHR